MDKLLKLEIKTRHKTERLLPVITHMLPYFKGNSGLSRYYHRIRSSNNHALGGKKITHTSVSFWCGGGGFIGAKGTLYANVPEDGVLCAICEGKAIGAGLDGARVINGREVMYKPREASLDIEDR